MSHHDVPHQTEPESGGYEKRDVNLTRIFVYGVLGLVALTVVILFSLDYFTAVREEFVYEAVLKPESVPLRELRASEEEELNSYAVLDIEKGLYRIPIERAMELIAEEAYRERTDRAINK
jgi:hypothetical protein